MYNTFKNEVINIFLNLTKSYNLEFDSCSEKKPHNPNVYKGLRGFAFLRTCVIFLFV